MIKIPHSIKLKADGSPGNAVIIKVVVSETAIKPIRFGYLTLYGRSKSGAFFLKAKNESETIKYAKITVKLPEFTSHVNIGFPSSGAAVDKAPTNKIALDGVLYFGCVLAKKDGSFPRFANAWIARDPPIKKEFQLVIIPPIPAKIKNLLAILLPLKAWYIASAVTRFEFRICVLFNTSDVAKIIPMYQISAITTDNTSKLPIFLLSTFISEAA